MRIVDIAERSVSIGAPIRNAVIDFSAMTISVVAVKTDRVVEGRPLIGYGFSSNGRYAQGGILRERVIPRLLATDPRSLIDAGGMLDPFACWDAMMRDEKPGGHGERSVAVGTIDMALWDLVAKAEGVPLYRLLADRYREGAADPEVAVYAAGGYYHPHGGDAALRDELRTYLDMGFTAVKMKIGGASLAEDCRRIETALGVVGTGDALAVDANARFGVGAALACARAIEPYRLRWYEEPVEVLDFAGLADVAAASATPIATGENIFSMVDSRNLVRHGGLDPTRDYLQMDPVLSYGLVEYLRTLDMLAAHGWSARRCVPHGGHQFGLHLAAGLGLMGNEAYPRVFEPFGRFAPDMKLANGKVRLGDQPGIGYEAIGEIYDILSTQTLS